MRERLADFLEQLKLDRSLSSLSEAVLKQRVILRMLDLLGWDIFDTEEVVPEYSIQGGRVDYSLRLGDANRVFLEVKKANEDLGRHEEQLLEYSFRMGVDLAVLTTGMTWWFYLPTRRGEWRKRRFYTIDLAEQETVEAAPYFLDLLSKQNILSGDALRAAEQILASEQKKKAIEEAIPEAWNRIISEPDSLLIDLLAETVERLCGFRPEEAELIGFLRSKGTHVVDVSPFSDRQESERSAISRPTRRRQVTTSQPTEASENRITRSQLIPHILQVLGQHGGRASKKQVEEELYSQFRSTFESDPWYQQMVSHGVPRWKHNIAWAKEQAKRQGLIEPPARSSHGVWQLTQQGRIFLQRRG